MSNYIANQFLPILNITFLLLVMKIPVTQGLLFCGVEEICPWEESASICESIQDLQADKELTL